MAFVVIALAGNMIAPFPAAQTDYNRVLQPPDRYHIMGTDHLGRDLCSRLLLGTGTTLGLAFAVAAANSGIALMIGAFCGFLGGWLDTLVMRIVDGLIALPAFLLAVCFLGIFGGGPANLMLFLVLTGWAQLSRVVRNEIAIVKDLDFITANRSVGYSAIRNIAFHALPTVLPTLLIVFVTAFIGDVFAIVSLTFLGLGVSAQVPEWGAVLFDARPFFLSSPWLFAFPTALIALFTLGMYQATDGLRDYLDKKRMLFTNEIRELMGDSRALGGDIP
jgi:peptide/nickel transport system permease protein